MNGNGIKKTETEITILDKKFKIGGKYIKTIRGFPNSEDKMLHNVFRISVTRIFDSGDKITKHFKYHGSYAEYEEGKKELNDFDLKWAFRCFIEDATAGRMEFDDFCNEFGYSDLRRAKKIWKECKKQLEKIYDLCIFESELYDIINELSKRGIE